MIDAADHAAHIDEMAMERFIQSRGGTPAAATPHPAPCADCGGTIPPARLHAVPTTRRCVRCQTITETLGG